MVMSLPGRCTGASSQTALSGSRAERFARAFRTALLLIGKLYAWHERQLSMPSSFPTPLHSDYSWWILPYLVLRRVSSSSSGSAAPAWAARQSEVAGSIADNGGI